MISEKIAQKKDQKKKQPSRSFERTYKFPLGLPKEFGHHVDQKEDKKRGENPKRDYFVCPPWYVKRECDNELKEWLRRNHSGTLLLTGYRGIGKSTCVENTILKLNDSESSEIEAIRVNFTTIFTLNSLAFLIAKKIGERVDVEIDVEEDTQNIFISGRPIKQSRLVKWIFNTEPGKLQYKIAKFLIRLSAKIETVANNGGHSAGLTLAGFGVTASEGVVSSQKNTLSRLTESEIVSNLKDIIYDYVKMREKEKKKKRILFVFDEIDKLKGFHAESQKEEEKIQEFEELVGKFKYILSNSEATFIFVAGKETYYRWQVDRSRGNSVYSSVFDHVLVVEPFLGGDNLNEDGCVKEKNSDLEKAQISIRKIVKKYLEDKYGKEDICGKISIPTNLKYTQNKKTDFEHKLFFHKRDIYKSFIRYLLWKSRGIPRKIIHELEYFIRSENHDKSPKHLLYFDTPRIRKIKFYSGLVKDIYARIVSQEKLVNDDILNLIILSEALFKFHRTGFSYADLKWITVSVDQENEVTNEYYHNLAIKLLEGWWMETTYGKKARYVFKPNIKAAINILSTNFQDESIIFKFEEKDFKNTKSYFANIDTRVEAQTDTQRINSIRVQTGMAKINMLLGKDFQAIEFYKKAIRLGIKELVAEKNDKIGTGNTRALTRIMADGYLEMGHIFEKQRSLREAMSFYLSAFLVVYKSHEKNVAKIPFDLEDIGEHLEHLDDFSSDEGVLSLHDPNGSYYAIGEEAIDALTHLSYIQWKFGKLRSAEKLLISALKIANSRAFPYKIASQTLLLGFFYFRIGRTEKAKEEFQEVITRYGKNTTGENTLLPHSITNATREAISCCTLSGAKGIKDLENTFDELEQVFCQIDTRADQREIIEIKLLKFRLYQRILRSEKTHKMSDPLHVDLINSLFPLIRNRSNDLDYRNENPISIRLYHHLAGMIAWHIFAIITERFRKKTSFVEIGEGIVTDVNDFFSKCPFLFASISKKCLSSVENFARGLHKNEPYLSWSYLSNEDSYPDPSKSEKRFNNFLDEHLFGRISNIAAFSFKGLNEIFQFIEQVLLLCHRVFHKNIFTAAASDPADRLGFFYFWVYSYAKDANFRKIDNFKFDKLDLIKFDEQDDSNPTTIEKYFNYSVSEQNIYKRYLPDHSFPNVRSQLSLGDIFYLKILNKKETTKELTSSDLKECDALERKCRDFYTKAIFALAKELELNFTETPLLHTIYFKETKMVPRLRMYDIAETRYRLRSIYLREGNLLRKKWPSFMSTMLKKLDANTNRDNKLDTKISRYDKLDLDNRDCVQQYCFLLKKIANSKRRNLGISENTDDQKKKPWYQLNEEIELLREVLEPWRYRENLTDSARNRYLEQLQKNEGL